MIKFYISNLFFINPLLKIIFSFMFIPKVKFIKLIKLLNNNELPYTNIFFIFLDKAVSFFSKKNKEIYPLGYFFLAEK